MRKTLWFIGIALTLAALVALTVDVWAWLVEGAWQPTSLAEAWAAIDPNSLVGFGALIEKEIDPDLWVDVVLPVIGWPLWVFPAVPGILLALIAWPRRRGEPRKRRIFSRKR